MDKDRYDLFVAALEVVQTPCDPFLRVTSTTVTLRGSSPGRFRSSDTCQVDAYDDARGKWAMPHLWPKIWGWSGKDSRPARDPRIRGSRACTREWNPGETCPGKRRTIEPNFLHLSATGNISLSRIGSYGSITVQKREGVGQTDYHLGLRLSGLSMSVGTEASVFPRSNVR